MSRPDIWAELSAAMASVTPAHTDRLLNIGVRADNLPLCGVARIRPEAEDFYVPDEHSDPAILLPVIDDRQVVDLLCFQSSQPDVWWVRRGECPLLGGDCINELWLGERLRLHKTPLSWLAGDDACGVAVLQWGPAIAHLANVPILEVEDKAHRAEVRGKLRRTVVLPKIEVARPTSTSEAAA